MSEPPRLPEWLVTEVMAWPEDAWGARHARLLLRDGRVVAPVAILPDGYIAGWGEAGEVELDADEIVAVERVDE